MYSLNSVSSQGNQSYAAFSLTCPNSPRGMKKAPIMAPITTRNFSAQNL